MFVNILTAISNTIGGYAENYHIGDSMHNQQLQEVKDCYNEVMAKNQINFFYNFLKKEYRNDEQLLCIIYSILYEVSEDTNILGAMYDILIEKNFDLFLLNSIRHQLVYKLFIRLPGISFYEKKMKLHNKTLRQLKCLSKFEVDKIPVSERDKRRVLIVTDQLLNIQHAPTAIVYRVSTILKKCFGFQVSVICMQTVINKDVQNYWTNSIFTNGTDILGSYYAAPYGEKIPVFYMPMEEKNLENIRQLCISLYQERPIFAWYIGGESIVGDFIGQMTTSLSMPCSFGYGVSEADFMIAYKKDNSQLILEQEYYLKEQKQSLLYLKVVSNHRENYTGKLTRQDFKASSKEFLIIIVGNRLIHEISEEFLIVLSEIVKINDNVKFVFCGEINENKQQRIDQMLLGTQYYLGYRKDLIDVISLCNLMINPPRVGGGGSAMMAIAMGIPIISLKHCDVAMVIKEDMCCDSIDEYPDLAKRYIMDGTFRVQQSNHVKDIYDSLGVSQFHQYIKEMLEQINEKASLGLSL